MRPSASSYLQYRAHLAMVLMDVGAVLTSASGFKLKHHEKEPDAPLSPIRFNLRMPPLTKDVVDLAGRCMQHVRFTEHLEFDAVVGVPEAGNPFAEVLARLSGKPCLSMNKEVCDGKRRVSSLSGTVPDNVRKALVVDDLVTRADSKLEAIDVLRRSGIKVSDVLVLIDREQGGRQELAQAGCELHSVFTITSLLDLYVAAKRLDPKMYAAIREYLGQPA